ncbi:nucleotidyltransferase substrate binding protein, HI0074 family [Cyclonatronum proteinivorum]|uniref:Nucleotidyltransferase substrate binding protein, HI0074 family n=1 Tax=Cyclonatronum proteinivorum TaxID=1457365 RepID=A0A345UJ95_9BACT|nr:nucleotidyltransferase substrate binding protein [Cyclonatronum proteinivorum]AXJ00547.1 nucleotidyltransferase substrate binding protein, HI0074 family [Cyclonatronum proteinivorum]
MTKSESKWMLRFNNYCNALAKLESGVDQIRQSSTIIAIEKENLDEMVLESTIQRFEYTHELACKLMKAYLENEGIFNLIGSKDATREAFKAGLIEDGELWMEMIRRRNLSSHTYDEANAQGLFEEILHAYLPAFKALRSKMETLSQLL